MYKFETFLFLVLVCHTPHTCRTQPLSGEPLIIETKNLLAVTDATVKSANIDGAKTQTKIKEVIANLQHNAAVIRKKINVVVSEALIDFKGRIDSLGVNGSDTVVNECAKPISSVKSTAADILMDANSCVSNTVKSIERELNDTYSSIESILARINSDHSLAETCVAEYGKTKMALGNAILTALCVTQAKERILSAIKDELSTRNDTAFLHVLYIDATNRVKSCDDSNSVSSFVAETDFIYVKIKNCISNLEPKLKPLTKLTVDF